MLLKRPLLAAVLVFVVGLALLPNGMLRVLSHPENYPCEVLPTAVIPAGPIVFTAAHVTAWTPGGAQRLVLVNRNTGREKILSRLPVLRHRNFDLTSDLDSTAAFELQLRSTDNIRPTVEEFSLRRCPALVFFPPVHWLCVGAFLIYMVAWILSGRAIDDRHWICAVTLLGFLLRWNGLGAAFGFPVEGDADGYYDAAAHFSWAQPLSTGFREPLYIWLLAAVKTVFGPSPFYVQLVTTLLSTGVVALTMRLVLSLSQSRVAAIVGGLLMAVGDFVVFNAARGERSELFVFLLLLYFWLLLRKPAGVMSEIVLGAVGGLVGLTWLVGAITVVLTYPYRWWSKKLPWTHAVAFLAMCVLVLSPHLIDQWRTSGDAFRALNTHVNFYKNAAETGVPSYEGAKTSWFSYLFFNHHLGELIGKTLHGYVNLFLNPLDPANRAFLGFHPSRIGSLFVFPFLLLGLAGEALRKNGAVFWLLLGTLNIMPSFLSEIRDPRLFVQVAPFFAYFVGSGAAWVVGRVGRQFR